MADVALDNPRRGARTRRRVLRGNARRCSRRPLAEVQLRHIADRAGISPGHVLYHFGSKDGILVEALRWSEESLARQRAQELASTDDPVARLERWILLYLPHESNDPGWKLWLELWLRWAMDSDLRWASKAIADGWFEDLDRILANVRSWPPRSATIGA